jgi:hypothetical protein
MSGDDRQRVNIYIRVCNSLTHMKKLFRDKFTLKSELNFTRLELYPTFNILLTIHLQLPQWQLTIRLILYLVIKSH